MEDKKQDTVYNQELRDMYDRGYMDGKKAGYKAGVFHGMREFQKSQKKIQL